ncbi:SEC10 Exocyst complex component SEC10 [Candida maltosa Xu316]|uniref:Uncharacterized protein n=1 Tax=Candida maltosa (strain Xu316) TaxID=1245528 RepID=M3JYE7_CANMX|nr:hypothetical protein G210_2222 [Candida maltosa Xu316]
MSFSIYELDENILKLLTVDNFLNGMSVNDFIEEISKDHFLKGAEVNNKAYLDPKPYIRTFESTLRELKQLQIHANDSKVKNERSVDSYELKHSENVLDLNAQINHATEKFDLLDTQISDVSSKINPLGNTLNKITNSRDRSQETIFLIRAYHGFFTKEQYLPLETLRTSRKLDDKLKCAKTVRNLLNLAKKVSDEKIAKSMKCISTIESFGDVMEKELLRKFEIASEDEGDIDFDMMNEIAKILFEYNEGINVIQTFVIKNDILIHEENNDTEEPNWTLLADPNYNDFKLDHQSVFDNLKFEIKARARMSRKVFADPIPVVKIFIQRMYAQIIRNKVTSLLQKSLTISSLAHVRVLHSLFTMVGDFTGDIKDFLTTEEFDKDQELSNILDQSYCDLFVEYIGDNVYFSREKKNLEEIVYEIIHKFNTANETVITNKLLATRVENLDNLEYTPQRPENDRFSFASERKRMNEFTKYVTAKIIERSGSRNSDYSEPTPNEYKLLDVAQVETVLKSVIESVARILELVPNKAPEYAFEILEILIIDFGKLYIGGGLEVVYDECKKNNSLDYLGYFNSVSELLFLISSCIKRIILPIATNIPSIKTRMSNLVNGFVAQCEISLNIILKDTLEQFKFKFQNLLSKQKKKDFNCSNIEDDTEACELVSDFLVELHTNISTAMNGTNLEKILIKIGMEVLHQLLEHYKKFTVNSIGGIVLTKDVIRYQSVIDTWEIPELSEQFQILKEIGNLFTVQADLVNSLIKEGQLAHMKPYTVRQYISKREDFNPSYADRFFKFK